MKRKTNVFYLDNNENEFITFSNYTEALTGNFLATNYKLFPSRFVCFNIPKLENSLNFDNDKKDFIKNYITAKYENKLAVLRDHYTYENSEEKLLPLNYLIEAIQEFDSTSYISFISDIVEQDYNGTFTDTICNINYDAKCCGDLSYVSEFTPTYITTEKTSYLYGWNGNMPAYYVNVKPKYDLIEDDTYFYRTNSYISGLILTEKTGDIKFNTLVPLFDLVNIDYSSTKKSIISLKDEQQELSLIQENNKYISNIPLGLWFSGKDPIILKRDTISNYSPSWSLSIASQFKPFPNMNKMPSENQDSAIAEGFNTFSYILCQTNALAKSITDIFSTLNEFDKRIKSVEAKLNNTDLSYNVVKLREEVSYLDYKIETYKEEFDEFKQNSYVKWN